MSSSIAFALVGTNDHERAFKFYDNVLEKLGIYPAITLGKMRYYGKNWYNGGPIFGVTVPINRQPASVGNGCMVAFRAETEQMIDDAYHEAIRQGGECVGPPMVLKNDETQRVYGAYFRDLDGNKIELMRMVFLPEGHIELKKRVSPRPQ